MLERMDTLQALRCKRCRQVIEIPRPVAVDPELNARFAEETEQMHRCKNRTVRPYVAHTPTPPPTFSDRVTAEMQQAGLLPSGVNRSASHGKARTSIQVQ